MLVRLGQAARALEPAAASRTVACRRCGSSRPFLRSLGRDQLAAPALASATHRTYATAVETKWFTDAEKESAKLLEAVKNKAEQCRAAQESDGDSVQEKVERAKILKQLSPLADAYDRYAAVRQALTDLEPHLSDPDPSIREMFAAEREELVAQLDEALTEFPKLVLPPTSTGALPLMMSLNSAVGGSESALFVEELARMYTRFAEKRGWKVEVLSQTAAQVGKGTGGLREITMKIEPSPYGEEGDQVYGRLRFERGVHRVQRVPLTETAGRVHTSTVTAVVMPIYADAPEAPLVDPKDVKTDVMRAGGAGGQHVNKTESAVRLTHLPTGITVSMQDSRSQHQNRAWAWDVLRARLSERKHREEIEARRAGRRSQVKSADRSDKVRTYNFPQDRLTDHRIGLSLTGLKGILDGDDLELVISALQDDFNSRRLESILQGEEDLDE